MAQGVGQGRFGGLKRLIRTLVPLEARKSIAVLAGRQRWLPANMWSMLGLLSDFAADDPGGFHRFLWSHHLGYAETYDVPLRFGGTLHASRRILFEDLEECLGALGRPPGQVQSVLEIGCSLGYNLRFLETALFPQAPVLEGCDIDAYAIERGGQYLRDCGSRIRLALVDMAHLDEHLRDRTYDVTVCAGVLMYLGREEAERAVASIIRRTGVVAAFAGLADPQRDNATLRTSGVRARDETFIHNIDEMVSRSGASVVRRRWEGAREVDGNSLYFVFAKPGDQ